MALADAREAAETLAERRLQLGAKRVDGQRRHPRRVAFGQRPDHGRAAARERQERDRAARGEPLERSPVERRLGAAIEDDGALAVVVLGRLDAERSPHRRAHAVGGDDERGAHARRGLALLHRDHGAVGFACELRHLARRQHGQTLGIAAAVPTGRGPALGSRP